MVTNSDDVEDWEVEGVSMLAPMRAATDPLAEGLSERALQHVYTSISAHDLVEFGTTVMVQEFLGPVLDMFAFCLGLEE